MTAAWAAALLLATDPEAPAKPPPPLALALRVDAAGTVTADLREHGGDRWLADVVVRDGLRRALTAAVGGRLDPDPRTAQHDLWYEGVRGVAPRAGRRGWLAAEGAIDLAPLLAEARRLGADGLAGVSVVLPRSASFALEPDGFAPPRWYGRGDESTVYRERRPWPAGGPSVVRYRFGHAPAELLGLLVPLAAAALAAGGMALAVRAALAGGRTDPETKWHRFARHREFVRAGVWLGWWFGLGVAGGHLPVWFAARAWGDGTGAVALALLVTVPPAAVDTLLAGWAAPVWRRLRGRDLPAGHLRARCGWGYTAFLGLVIWILLSVSLWADDRSAARWALAAAALVLTVYAFGAWQSLSGRLWAVQVKEGPLKDRFAELAARFKMQNPVVRYAAWPAEPFALGADNQLWVRPDLLRRLDRDEVDALIARELTSRKFGVPGGWGGVVFGVAATVGGYAVLGLVVGAGMVVWRASRIDMDAAWPAAVAALAGLFWLPLTSGVVRDEKRADAAAVEQTDEPAPLITGLVKLAEVSGWPVPAGRWQDHSDTEPPTLARVNALARDACLSPEQLADLLATADLGDHYPAPAEEGEGLLFSPVFRQRLRERCGWALTFGFVAAAVASAHVAAAVPAAGWWAWLAAVPFGYAVLRLYRPVQRSAYARLRRDLAARFATAGTDTTGAAFAGLAPAPGLPLYEGFLEWDDGFVFAAGDRLAFAGEKASFALRRDQVTAVRVRPAGLIRPRRVVVEVEGGSFGLIVRPGQRTVELVRGWHERGGGGELPPALAALPDAPPAAVPGDDSGTPKAGHLLIALAVTAVMALIAAWATGLTFDDLGPGSAWAAAAAAPAYVVALTVLEQAARRRA